MVAFSPEPRSPPRRNRWSPSSGIRTGRPAAVCRALARSLAVALGRSVRPPPSCAPADAGGRPVGPLRSRPAPPGRGPARPRSPISSKQPPPASADAGVCLRRQIAWQRRVPLWRPQWLIGLRPHLKPSKRSSSWVPTNAIKLVRTGGHHVPPHCLAAVARGSGAGPSADAPGGHRPCALGVCFQWRRKAASRWLRSRPFRSRLSGREAQEQGSRRSPCGTVTLPSGWMLSRSERLRRLTATLLRHIRARRASFAPPLPVSSLALSMMLAPRGVSWYPLVGGTLVLKARRSRTKPTAVDVPAVARSADDHLCSAPGASIESLTVTHLWNSSLAPAAGFAGGMMLISLTSAFAARLRWRSAAHNRHPVALFPPPPAGVSCQPREQ